MKPPIYVGFIMRHTLDVERVPTAVGFGKIEKIINFIITGSLIPCTVHPKNFQSVT